MPNPPDIGRISCLSMGKRSIAASGFGGRVAGPGDIGLCLLFGSSHRPPRRPWGGDDLPAGRHGGASKGTAVCRRQEPAVGDSLPFWLRPKAALSSEKGIHDDLYSATCIGASPEITRRKIAYSRSKTRLRFSSGTTSPVTPMTMSLNLEPNPTTVTAPLP